jgi:DNA-directed RNA polymerase specialized sigma24 family protein
MDTPSDSVTRLLSQLKAGQESSVEKLWERYFHRLVAMARTRLPAACRQAADEEDIALSAFASFCRGVDAGMFPRLDDRDNLWRILLTLVTRKASHLLRDVHRGKRDIFRLLDEAGFDNRAVDQFVDDELTPEFAAEVAEECKHLLAILDSDELRQVAILKMEGYANAEIAERLDCAPRTVDRRLQLIRELWTTSAPDYFAP